MVWSQFLSGRKSLLFRSIWESNKGKSLYLIPYNEMPSMYLFLFVFIADGKNFTFEVYKNIFYGCTSFLSYPLWLWAYKLKIMVPMLYNFSSFHPFIHSLIIIGYCNIWPPKHRILSFQEKQKIDNQDLEFSFYSCTDILCMRQPMGVGSSGRPSNYGNCMTWVQI